MAKTRVLIADDHAVLREGMRRLLEQEKDMEVVGEASDGEEAVTLVDSLKPDIVLMDIVMPKLTGVEATKLIKKANPSTCILILTAYSDIRYILGLLEAGASGYLLKSARSDEIVGAIRAVRSGESVLDSLATRKLLERVVNLSKETPEDRSRGQLSPREIEILRLAARGMSNRDIAEKLELSMRTVKAHLSNIFNKMRCSCRTEAIVKGFREGYVTLDDVPQGIEGYEKEKYSLPDQDYRYLFENASDAIWVQDLEGHILYANRAAERLTGYEHDDLLNQDVIKFLPDAHSHDIAREVRRRLLSGEDFHQPYEQRILRRDGSVGVWRMATSTVITDGEVRGFQHIARDITAEKQLQDNMRYYVQEVIRAQEDERKRVARELHDEVSPALLLLIQRIDAISSNIRLKLSDVMKQKMEDLRVQTVEALESTRRIAQDLRPRILDDLGLIPALEWMGDNLIKKHGIEARVAVSGREQLLSGEVQLLLFRIVQEALNNVRKHSDASQVDITVNFGEEKTTVAVADNGKGFTLPDRVSDLAAGGKLGLAGMRERAQLIGGNVTMKSEPGRGTTVTVEVPNQGNLCELPTPAQELERRLRT